MHTFDWRSAYRQLTRDWDEPFNPEWWFEFFREQAAGGMGAAPASARAEGLIAFEMEYLLDRELLDLPLVHFLLINLCREAGISVGAGSGVASSSHLLHALGVTRANPCDYALIPELYLLRAAQSRRIQLDIPPDSLDDVRRLAEDVGITEQWNLDWVMWGESPQWDPAAKAIAVGVAPFHLGWKFDLDLSPVRLKARTRDELAVFSWLATPFGQDRLLPNYEGRFKGLEKPEPPHPAFESVLRHTLGLCISNEDLLLAIRDLGDCTLSEADQIAESLFRRAWTDPLMIRFSRRMKEKLALTDPEVTALLRHLTEWCEDACMFCQAAAMVSHLPDPAATP